MQGAVARHDEDRASASVDPVHPVAERWLSVAFAVVVTWLSLVQQPGRTTYDTRAELTERPGDFLAGAFRLWHPENNLGEFQNQAYGYLFPHGPWFLLGELLSVPDWVVQRLWSALVLVVAYEGARRVAGAVGLGTGGRVLAGLVFALAPRVLGTVGVLTGETVPGAVMPWVVLPVLLALRGRIAPRRAAVLSAAAVVCMGGVNAVEVAGSLPLAILLVGWGVHQRLVPRLFAAWWAGAVALAALWWALPLLVLARYAPSFYEYVESARDTTALVGWSEALRGATQWTSYVVVGGQPWWPAAYSLSTTPALMLAAAAITGIGLVGLVRLRSALRAPLVASVVLGLVALTIGRGGATGSLLAEPMLALLDGPLQIFRNVHKIDPVVRLPLAIGFAHACVLAARIVARRSVWTSLRPTVLAVPALLPLVLLAPFVQNDARTPGWTEIADHWVAARDHLQEAQAADPARRAALVLPGSGFAHHDWGWTLDEPLVVLGGVRTVSRSQVPLVPGQTIRFLDALDRDITRGLTGEALVEQLARVGIGHVVVRDDLDRAATGSPDPAATLAALDRAGLEPAAVFGGSEEQPAVQVFAVPAAASLPDVRTTAERDVLRVAGAPETALGLQDLGLLQPGQATVLAGDARPDGAGPPAIVDVSTDGAQRRERAFGRVDESTSVVLGPDDPWRLRRAAHDYPGAEAEEPVVAGYRGFASVTASSSQGYADTYGPVTPQDGPHAAADGLLGTRWVTSVDTRADRQWWRARFVSPRAVREVEVLPAAQDGALLTIRSIEVVAGDQRQEVRVPAGGAPVRVALDGSRVPFVEVRITGVRDRHGRGRIGLREVRIDGAGGERHLVVPAVVGERTGWAARTVPARRACLPRGSVPDCSTDRIRSPEEADGIVRRWTFVDGGRWQLGGRVLARSGLAASRLLDPLDPRQTVAATSVFGDDPQVSARFAHDGDPRTAWLSASQDRVPTLVFEWDRPRRVRGLQVVVGATGPVADLAPVAALVRSGRRVQRVALDGEVTVPLDPVRTRRLEVAFVPREDSDRVAVGELRLLGADVTVPFDPATPTGAVCGFGPPVQVAGRNLPTRVAGTMGDIVDGTPLTWSTCTPGATGDEDDEGDEGDDAGTVGDADVAPVDRGTAVEIPGGTHDVRTAPSAEFAALTLGARPAGTDLADAGQHTAREVTISDWAADRRTLEVGAGSRALLWLPHSLNEGWVAELDGVRLGAQRVDGWQQGWWLPAGAGGTVEIRFVPQGTYDVVLPGGLAVSGAVLLAGLLTLPGAVRRSRERPNRPWPAAGPKPQGRGLRARRLPLVLLVAWAVVAGPIAALATGVAVAAGRQRRVQWWLVVLLGAAPVVATLLDLGGGWWQLGLAEVVGGAGVGLLVGLAAVRPSPAVTGAAS